MVVCARRRNPQIIIAFQPAMLYFRLPEYNHSVCGLMQVMEPNMMPRHRVLLVEDDADTLQLMRLVLSELPLDIEPACSGAEAIALIEQAVP